MATLAICVVGSRTILLNVQPHGQFATGLVLVLACGGRSASWRRCRFRVRNTVPLTPKPIGKASHREERERASGASGRIAD